MKISTRTDMKPERAVSYTHPLFEHISGYPSAILERVVAYQTADDVERIETWEHGRETVRIRRLTR